MYKDKLLTTIRITARQMYKANNNLIIKICANTLQTVQTVINQLKFNISLLRNQNITIIEQNIDCLYSGLNQNDIDKSICSYVPLYLFNCYMVL